MKWVCPPPPGPSYVVHFKSNLNLGNISSFLSEIPSLLWRSLAVTPPFNSGSSEKSQNSCLDCEGTEVSP